MSTGGIHADPWRLTCPEGHVSVSKVAVNPGGDRVTNRHDVVDRRWKCKGCGGEKYAYAIDKKHDTLVRA